MKGFDHGPTIAPLSKKGQSKLGGSERSQSAVAQIRVTPDLRTICQPLPPAF